MGKTLASRPAKTPARRKGVSSKSHAAKAKIPKPKTPKTKTPKPSSLTSKVTKSKTVERATPKKPRANVIIEHPKNLCADASDPAALEAIAKAVAKADAPHRASGKRSAVDRIDDPVAAGSRFTMVERVSNAIERELSRIEIIIGGGARTPPMMRSEAESRARVLASLARTLKEVMRLREQERDAKGEARAANDDIPRDLDTLRSELARRLEIIVGDATRLHPDATE